MTFSLKKSIESKRDVPKCPWLFTQTRPCCWAAAWGMYHAADGPVGSVDTASFQKLNWLMKSREIRHLHPNFKRNSLYEPLPVYVQESVYPLTEENTRRSVGRAKERHLNIVALASWVHSGGLLWNYDTDSKSFYTAVPCSESQDVTSGYPWPHGSPRVKRFRSLLPKRLRD